MSDDIYHLAYVSDAQLVDPSEAEQQDVLEWQLKRILDAAHSNNSAAGVTGALLFSGRHFAQVLEGPQAAINERYRRISQDTRHNNVTPLLYEPAGERQFADWSMALCGAEEVEDLPDNFQVKPSPGSLEAGSLGRSIVASLAAAIGKRQTA
jgi:hypothetical protein